MVAGRVERAVRHRMGGGAMDTKAENQAGQASRTVLASRITRR